MADTTQQQIAQKVAAHIKDSGVTIVWLCEKSGIPRSTLLRRLNGSTPFNINELERIAAALRVPTTELMAVAA